MTAATRCAALESMPDLLTVPEFASWARCGRNQAYKAVHDGRVPSIRLTERTIRIPKAALERLTIDPGGPRA